MMVFTSDINNYIAVFYVRIDVGEGKLKWKFNIEVSEMKHDDDLVRCNKRNRILALVSNKKEKQR